MKTTLLLGLLVVVAAPVLADENPMKPGMWEITTHMDMPGMPYKMPPMTFKHCVTPAMLAKDHGLGDQKSPPGTHCERSNMKFSGNQAQWSLSCTGKDSMTGHGTVTWDSANSYHGESHISMQMDGHATEMTQTMSGKRLGDCSK